MLDFDRNFINVLGKIGALILFVYFWIKLLLR